MAWSLELKWGGRKSVVSPIGFTKKLSPMDTSLFYRHSTVIVTEGKAIQSEFLHVMTCEDSREMRNQRSVQPHGELWITCLGLECERPCNFHGETLRGPDLGMVERRTVKLRTKNWMGWEGVERDGERKLITNRNKMVGLGRVCY
jgi:hypothetical protein